MRLKFKNNFAGYFKFYYKIIGIGIFISIFLSIVISALDGIGLAMLIPLLQTVEGDTTSTKESMGQLNFLIEGLKSLGLTLDVNLVLFIIIILFSLKGLVRFLDQYYQVKIIHLFMKKIRYILVHNLNKLSYEGYLSLDAGSIQNSFIAEVHRMSHAVKAYLKWTQAILMLMTYIILALMANYQFAILVVISAGLSNILYRKIYTEIKKLSNDISLKGNNFNAYMIEAIHNYKYLKSTNYINIYTEKLRIVIDKTEKLNKKTGLYNAITNGLREPMIIIIVVLVMFLHVNLLGGTIGSIILSLLLLYRGLNFLIVIQNEWQLFIQNIGALRTVTNIANKMDQNKEINGKLTFNILQREIKLTGINFFYGNINILKNINIIIPKNKTIALVGGSGSGKTTLANLICGLIKPKSGTILIDGLPVENFDLSTFREKIGYISQESAIFNDTIYNNVTFWSEPTPENIQKFWDVINLASLEKFINSLSLKENTPLGDNGMLISGGQRQRISIARELYKNPEILILDEATSALDSETEFLIQENIEKLQGSYTFVIIAHRLSTLRSADLIYLLDEGKITATGEFNHLLEISESFRRMTSLQGLEVK